MSGFSQRLSRFSSGSLEGESHRRSWSRNFLTTLRVPQMAGLQFRHPWGIPCRFQRQPR